MEPMNLETDTWPDPKLGREGGRERGREGEQLLYPFRKKE